MEVDKSTPLDGPPAPPSRQLQRRRFCGLARRIGKVDREAAAGLAAQAAGLAHGVVLQYHGDLAAMERLCAAAARSL